jgi:endonuclease/exonuclease/phosphatase family metal-dependent hydrolase
MPCHRNRAARLAPQPGRTPAIPSLWRPFLIGGAAVRLTVGTWNLKDGGGTRLRRQLDVLADRNEVDAWAFQEAKGWNAHGGRLLHQAADRLQMTARFLIPSNHHGCDLAMLVRERPGLRVVQERHDRATPWWHALGDLELDVEGITLHFLNIHLAPSAPSIRENEAEALGLYRGRWAIAAGDFNAVPATGPLPDLADVSDMDKAHRKLDRRAAQAIQAAGFHDVGGHLGDTTPTVGHNTPGALAYQCDRIESTLPPDTYDAFEVLPIHQPPYTNPGDAQLSDHCPALATFTINATTLGQIQ